MKLAVLIIIITLALLLIGARKGRVDYNCKDFDTQQQAQALFIKNKKDIYKLDGNHNGIACEGLR